MIVLQIIGAVVVTIVVIIVLIVLYYKLKYGNYLDAEIEDVFL